MRARAEGFTVREATPPDHEGIIALCHEVFSANEGATVRHLLRGEGYGPGRWTVAVDADDAVVSCCTLLPHRLRYGAVEVPAAQIEFVATKASARRRGLVRAQFDLHHRVGRGAGCPRGDHHRDPLPLPPPRLRLRHRVLRPVPGARRTRCLRGLDRRAGDTPPTDPPSTTSSEPPKPVRTSPWNGPTADGTGSSPERRPGARRSSSPGGTARWTASPTSSAVWRRTTSRSAAPPGPRARPRPSWPPPRPGRAT